MIRPNDPKLRIFSLAISACKATLPGSVRRIAGRALFLVTPKVPSALYAPSPTKGIVGAFSYGAGLTFVLCWGVVRVWTAAVGTYDGTDPSRRYFAHDLTNQVNYTVVCPLYVGLACVLVLLAGRSWLRASREGAMMASDHRSPRLPIGVAILAILAAAFGFTARYISDCLNPHVLHQVPWFVAKVDADGDRILGALGVYYSLINFCLLAVSLAALVSLLPIVATAAEVATHVRGGRVSEPQFDAMRESLQDFIWAYIAAKALTATLIMNVWTWQWDHPEHSVNFMVLGGVLAICGVFVVSLPHYYVELAWFDRKVQLSMQAGEAASREAEDLRPAGIRMAAFFLDTFIVSSFAWTFIRIYLPLF